MSILPIVTYPNPLLQKKSQEIVDPNDPEIQRLILDMLETLKDCKIGIGLAAPQVGKSLSLCVIRLDGKTHILLNPKIKSKSWKKIISEEGCLSFPNKFILVKRSCKAKVTAVNEKGEKIEIKAEGLLARALQHEIDHLDGVLYIEREARGEKS